MSLTALIHVHPNAGDPDCKIKPGDVVVVGVDGKHQFTRTEKQMFMLVSNWDDPELETFLTNGNLSFITYPYMEKDSEGKVLNTSQVRVDFSKLSTEDVTKLLDKEQEVDEREFKVEEIKIEEPHPDKTSGIEYKDKTIKEPIKEGRL